jgi:hypothetical protein
MIRIRHAPRMAILVGTFAGLAACHYHQKFAVTTYHYDNLRTGWNSHEEKLTPATVQSSHFGVLYTTILDEVVNTQPLVVPDQTITGGSHPGKYDVVYVATENNTVYAIDAGSGTVLLTQPLGAPIPVWGAPIGIDGTPVIDRGSNTMYVLAYTMVSGVPAYQVHALDLSTLADKIPPPTVSASHALTDGSGFSFIAGWQRQRPALLLANGNLYAAFGSFGDGGGSNSRGWVLGWSTPSLAALPNNQLNNRLVTTPDSLFLTSVWMSGYGIAADPAGNLYFVTGNSDVQFTPCCTNVGQYQTTYQGAPTFGNIQNSVVSVPPDLSGVRDLFTPWAQTGLDQVDADYGSGGAMLLPDVHGPVPHLVAAAGKDGKMYILNRDNLGGYNPPQFGSGAIDTVVAEVNIGACWCGPSYFDSDGPYIVSSGGANAHVWKVHTSESVSLIHEGVSPPLDTHGDGGFDAGFMTSVSSDGQRHAIIWAVSRPDSTGQVWLFAFEAKPPHGSGTLKLLYNQAIGVWKGGNSNVVPVVANGKVYVATYQKLTIFGLH